MKIAVVIPFYNEVNHVTSLIQNLSKYNVEIILVDDGSKDKSILNKIRNKITVLTHGVNLGKGAAMKTGSDYAFLNGFDGVVFMDADGQHSANDLLVFLKNLKSKKFDAVLGFRDLNLNSPFVRMAGNKVASFVIGLLFNIHVKDPLCGFRALTKKGYSQILWDSVGYSVESEMLARISRKKVKYLEVPIQTIYHDRDKGVSVLDAFGVLIDVLKWKVTL